MKATDLKERGFREYHGEKMYVYFNKDLCEHAAKCVGNSPEVFDTKRKPWILPDNAGPDEVENTIKLCPSGALQYIRKELS